MDPFLARTMVESLSRGVDPLSGRALPLQDSCSKEEVQNALLEMLDHCTIESNEQYLFRLKEEKAAVKQERRERNARKYPRGGSHCTSAGLFFFLISQKYRRGGEPWSDGEIQQLLQMHHKGFNIYKIANILKRTPRAIEARLKDRQERPIYRNKTNEK